jgi:hypothetical protein
MQLINKVTELINILLDCAFLLNYVKLPNEQFMLIPTKTVMNPTTEFTPIGLMYTVIYGL